MREEKKHVKSVNSSVLDSDDILYASASSCPPFCIAKQKQEDWSVYDSAASVS